MPGAHTNDHPGVKVISIVIYYPDSTDIVVLECSRMDPYVAAQLQTYYRQHGNHTHLDVIIRELEDIRVSRTNARPNYIKMIRRFRDKLTTSFVECNRKEVAIIAAGMNPMYNNVALFYQYSDVIIE
jgi:hypothetical protein